MMKVWTHISDINCPSAGNKRLRRIYGSYYIEMLKEYAKEKGYVNFSHIEYNPSKFPKNNLAYFSLDEFKFGEKVAIKLEEIFPKVKHDKARV